MMEYVRKSETVQKGTLAGGESEARANLIRYLMNETHYNEIDTRWLIDACPSTCVAVPRFRFHPARVSK